MNIIHLEASVLLEKALKRLNPAQISREAGVPSFIIMNFMECGDFRHTPVGKDMEKLLGYLQRERGIYASSTLMTYTNDELLKELKERLVAG